MEYTKPIDGYPSASWNVSEGQMLDALRQQGALVLVLAFFYLIYLIVTFYWKGICS